MEHGVTWMAFVPGLARLEEWVRVHLMPRGFLHHPVVLQHVAAALLVALILLFLAGRAAADMRRGGAEALVPAPELSVRNFLEVLLEALYGQMRQIIGPDSARYFPVIGALALFILTANLLGLVPGFTPPTDNWNTTFACGIFVFLYYNGHGLRAHGWGHIAHLANPAGQWWGWFLAPLMFPIEVVSHIARPFSLGVRLAANMMGDHAVLLAFVGLFPILLPLPLFFLDLVVAVVQTLVFVLLSMIYVGLATAGAHDEAGEASH